MNKTRLPYVIAVVVILLSCLWYSASAATILFPSGGGTGSSTLTGLLKGNGLGPVLTAIPGTDYSNFAYPFPSNATSTALTFNAAFSVLNPSTTQGAGTYLGTDSTHGIKVGYYNANNYALWAGGVTPGATNYGFLLSNNGTSAQFNSTDNIEFNISDVTKLAINNTGGVTLTSLGNGLVKSASGLLSNASNGTDYTLITANTCGAGNHVSAITAAGVISCTADTGSGGSGLATTSPVSSSNVLVYSASGAGSAYGVATTSATLGLGLSGALTTLGSAQSLSVATSSLFTGTVGQNAYFNGTNSLVGTSSLFTSTAGNVEIGGVSPQARLHVETVATPNTTVVASYFANTTSGNNAGTSIRLGYNSVTSQTAGISGYFGNDANAGAGPALGLSSGGLATNYAVLSPFGHFGIGTTLPTASLQVTQATTGPGNVTNTAGGTTVTGSGTDFLNMFKVGDTITIGGQTVAITAIASSVSMTTATITNANTNAAYTLTGGTRFQVFGNGNIGIGTTTPYARLSITGDAVLGASTAGGTPGDLFLPKLGTSAGSFLAVDATGKVIATTTPASGTTYTATYPVTLTGSAFGLAFGTTTANSWSALQQFNANASTTQLTTTGSTYLATAGGNVGIGSTSPFAPLSLVGDFQQYGTYAHFGSAVPLFKSPAQSALELWGDDNTTNGVQVTIGNRNAGTSAYSGLNILNDVANSNTTNFAGLYLNSSTYTDTSFGTAEAFSNLLMLQNTLGATSFINSTTSVSSAYFNWIAGGSATSNEIARLTGAGNFGIGTTSPYAKFSLGGGNLVIGAATAGGTLGDLYLPKLGTSAGSFLAVDATGKVIATTTPTSSITGTTGQLPYFSASNTLSATSTLNISTASLVGIGSSTPSALATIGYGYQPSAFTIASTSVWAAGSYQYTAPTGTGYVQISLSGGGGSGDTGVGGQGAFVASSTIFMKGGDTGTIYVAQGGKFSGAQATGYKTGGLGASNVRNGGASSAFTASSTNQSLIACGGGGSGDTNGGSNATANSGGAGGAGGGSFAGGGGGCGTNGGNASGGTPGVGGTGGTYLSSLAGNAGSSGGNNGGDGKVTVIAYAVPAGTTGIQLIAGLLTVNPSAVTIGTTTPQGTFTVQGVTGGTAEAIYSDSAPSQILNTLISSITYAVQIIDQYGHLKTGGPAPTVGTCAGFSASAGADDRTGTISMTSGTTCSINFAKSYDATPVCVVAPGTTASTIRVVPTTTGLSVTFGSSETSFGYICQQHQ